MTYIPNEIADDILQDIRKPKRPLMRYFGGKWKIAPWICSFFPEHRVYVEPFGGAASVLFTKAPSLVEVYNDVNSELVNVFKVLRDPVRSERLIQLLRMTPYSRDEFEGAYPKVSNSIEQARRTLVLAEMSMNSGKSLNRKKCGFRCTSGGHHRLPEHWKGSIDNLQLIIERIRGVIIENRDAFDLIHSHDHPDALLYLDPPYLGSSRRRKENIYPFEAKDEKFHRELAYTAHSLKGMVVVSGYSCTLYHELYTDAGWEPHSTQAVIGGSVKNGSTATEVIWLNPMIAEKQRQLKLQF